jgi:hypothetical protein
MIVIVISPVIKGKSKNKACNIHWIVRDFIVKSTWEWFKYKSKHVVLISVIIVLLGGDGDITLCFSCLFIQRICSSHCQIWFLVSSKNSRRIVIDRNIRQDWRAVVCAESCSLCRNTVYSLTACNWHRKYALTLSYKCNINIVTTIVHVR